jgi:tRNA(adenine34) deaminase
MGATFLRPSLLGEPLNDSGLGRPSRGSECRCATGVREFVTIPQVASPGPISDESAMRLALEEAALAVVHGDVPVGAVVLDGHRVVASRHNEREVRRDPTAHAELLALRDAGEVVGGWRLEGLTVVATLEPCPMCAGALVAARVARIVFGATDPRAGACGTLYNLCCDPRLNHEVAVTPGVLATESADLLLRFFEGRR